MPDQTEDVWVTNLKSARKELEAAYKLEAEHPYSWPFRCERLEAESNYVAASYRFYATLIAALDGSAVHEAVREFARLAGITLPFRVGIAGFTDEDGCPHEWPCVKDRKGRRGTLDGNATEVVARLNELAGMTDAQPGGEDES